MLIRKISSGMRSTGKKEKAPQGKRVWDGATLRKSSVIHTSVPQKFNPT